MRRSLVLFLILLVALLLGYAGGCASANGQPHMQAALDHLRSARQQLDAATADKGGHRSRALKLVDDAVSEVQAGIDYARAH